MRTLSFILAFAFVLAPRVAGLSDNLPGIGTFAYNGSPIRTPQAPQVCRGCHEIIRDSNPRKLPVRHHVFRISAAAIVACSLFGGSAQAQFQQNQTEQVQPRLIQFRSLAEAARSARRVRAPVRSPHARTLGASRIRLQLPA